jgi:uncharacterized phage protein gp47/JayE
MPFFPREEKDIVSEALQRMNSKTNITQLAPGGKARFFLTTVAREQARQQRLFDANLLQPYIKYSNGKFLDFFGDMLNLPRKESTHASANNNNFMFYTQSGKFGDLNAGSSFNIPAGTTVGTVPFEGTTITPGLEYESSIEYKTTSAVICNADSSYVYAPIRASIEGAYSSVPRNTLRQHDFDAYTLAASDLLKCTNKFAIDNGVDRERDESYRYRLSNIFAARNQAIYASIRLAALAVPGVADVVMINSEQGPGTFGMYIQSITPSVSPELVSTVSAAVNEVVSYGLRPFVSAPKTLGLEIVSAVNWSSRATAEEIAVGYRAMRNVVENTINELDIGEPLNFTDLIEDMLDVAPKANRIGQNEVNTFEQVYAHRYSPTSDSVTSRNLIFSNEIDPLYNEKLLLETSGRYRGIQFVTF